MSEPIAWLEDGTAHSPRFNDRYGSCAGGVAQALAVFMEGCGLPQGWRGRQAFTILETGFGLGLNFLTTWAAWEADPQRCGTLHFVSIEAYPAAAVDILRNAQSIGQQGGESCADALHARIAALVHELAAAWDGLKPGLNHLVFARGAVQLTLVVADIKPALQSLRCEADAVFLDGFSPSVNPDMWSRSTLQAVAAHVHPGSTLATYTVARAVRDALQELGFTVRKLKGLPPKRDRVAAVFNSNPHLGLQRGSALAQREGL